MTLLIDLFFTLVFFAVLYHHSPILTAVVVSLYMLLSVLVTPIPRKPPEDKFNRGAENQALVESVNGIQTPSRWRLTADAAPLEEQQLAGYVASSSGRPSGQHRQPECRAFVNKVTDRCWILWMGDAGDEGRAVGRPADRVQHDRRADQRSDSASGPVVAGLPAGRHLGAAPGDILNTLTEPGNPGARPCRSLKRARVRFDHVDFVMP